MGRGDAYRRKAAEIRAQAEHAPDANIKAELNTVADGFSRLADQTEKDPMSLINGFLSPKN